MSSRESLAAARTALEMIASVSEDPVAQKLAGRALQALARAEDEERSRRGADAERKRLKRLGLSADVRGHPPPSGDVHGRPPDSNGVRDGGRGGSLSSDPRDPDLNPDLLGGGAGGGVQRSPAPSTDVRGHELANGRTITNATDDGAFGMAVAAWCEGISLETGQPFARPAIGALRVLIGALSQHRPADAEPVEWAREVAREYARARRGGTLSPFDFANWMNSGKPVREERESGTRRRALPAVADDHNPNPVQRATRFTQAEIDARIAEAEAAAKAGAK